MTRLSAGMWACTSGNELPISVCRSDELGKLWSKAAAQLETLYDKVDKRQNAGQ